MVGKGGWQRQAGNDYKVKCMNSIMDNDMTMDDNLIPLPNFVMLNSAFDSCLTLGSQKKSTLLKAKIGKNERIVKDACFR